MRGIPGKEREAEPTCPECGHKWEYHDGFGCIAPARYCSCKLTPSDLQPKECDHRWVSSGDYWEYCGECGASRPTPIRPDSRKVVEKHCTLLKPRHCCHGEGSLECESCPYWQPVEPAEKEWVIRIKSSKPPIIEWQEQ